MQPFLYYLTFLAAGAVLVVLIAGVLNMGRVPKAGEAGTGSVTNLSQQLMRWRVILQLVAVLMLMLVLYLSR